MKKVMILLLLLVFILTTGCKKETETLKIGTMPTLTATIYAVGIEKGYFKKAGVSVELAVFNSAAERDSAATAGEVDGFLTDVMGAINLVDKGFNYKITSSEYENFSVMSMGESPVGRSLKIGISPNTIVDYLVEVLMPDQILDKTPVPKVPDRMNALINGDIELGIFPEPFPKMIMSKGGQVVASSAEANIAPVVFVFSEQLLRDNKEAVEQFYEGYNATIAYLQTAEFKEYQDILIQYGLASDENIALMAADKERWMTYHNIEAKDFDPIANWMVQRKIVENTYTLDQFIQPIEVK